MRFLVILFALIVSFASAQLPTPTPGLSSSGQDLNYLVITKGEVLAKATIHNRIYSVKRLDDVIVLYNDLDHAIILFQYFDNYKITLSSQEEDPYPYSKQYKIQMDSIFYSLKIVSNFPGIAAIYDENNLILFTISSDKPIAAMIPEP